MPSPSTAGITQRPDLASSFEEFGEANALDGFVADQVLRPVEVMSQAGEFGRIPIEQLLQKRDLKRAPGSGYARGEFTFATQNYSTKEYGCEEPIDDREAKMYAEYFDAEVVAAMRAYSAVRREAETRVADAVFNETTWSGPSLTTTVSTDWTDASSTPIADVESAVNKVYDGSGLWPNALIINRKVFRALRQCTEIIARIASSGAGSATKASDITESMLAQVFDLDRIIVAGQSTNRANKGQSADLGQIWSSDFAMVATVAQSTDFREPCIGRIFHWSEDGSSMGGTVETYREDHLRADVVRVRHDVDERILYPESAHLLRIVGE